MRDGRPHTNGNVVLQGSQATAWFRVPPKAWNWKEETDRDRMIGQSAQVWADLVGHTVRLRSTSAQTTRAGWEARVGVDAANPLPVYGPHNSMCVDRLVDVNPADKVVFAGVELGSRSAAVGLLLGLWGRKPLRNVDRIVAQPGWRAVPASAGELEWLWRRSTLLGHPSPVTSGIARPWEPDDLDEIRRTASWSCHEAYDRTVQITSAKTGRTVFVKTAVIGRMAEFDTQNVGPWLTLCDRLPFPVEMSATVRVVPTEQTRRAIRQAIQKARSQWNHWVTDHKMDAPTNLNVAAEAGLDAEGELDSSTSGMETRVQGWFRFHIWGDTEDEAVDRAEQVRELHKPLITVEPDIAGQFGLAAEALPDSHLSSSAFKRDHPVSTQAGGMPEATARVGHARGFYMGWTAGVFGRTAAFWDPWRPMETRPGDPPGRLTGSGAFTVSGGLGSGKSSLVGGVAYQAVAAGIQTTLLDPSGPLARLCYLPEFRGVARHVDLMNAQPGSLNPRRLIPVPARELGQTDAEHANAVNLAVKDARTLMADTLMSMLPATIREEHSGALVVVGEACRQAVTNHPRDWSPTHAIGELREIERGGGSYATHARVVADLLADMADIPAAQLIFDSGTPDLDAEDMEDPLLEVLSMRGMRFPKPGADRHDLSTHERLSMPVLSLAAWRVHRRVFSGDRNRRKLLVFDELHSLARTSMGRQVALDSGRDSRKHDVAVGYVSQQADDIQALFGDGNQQEIDNLITSRFGLRTTGALAQAALLKLLEIPAGVGFDDALGTLSEGAADVGGFREAIWNDGMGHTERIVIDHGKFPAHVRAALSTEPRQDVGSANGKVMVG